MIENTQPSARRFWTEEELIVLRDAYANAETSEDLDLSGLAEKLNRTRHSIATKAGRLGYTDISRRGVRVRADAPKYATIEEAHAAIGKATAARFAAGGHPRGMAGKRHSIQTREVIGAKSKAAYEAMPEDVRSDRVMKALKTKDAKGTGVNPGKSRGTWKAGWREIGGKRNYYRSRWEANYARYLQWLKERGEITEWLHEPETFWFDAIKRGVRSYKPDFRVWEKCGKSTLHEVKGWMDARSRTTLKRMAKYHPNETVIVIREVEYNSISRAVSKMIACWETSGRAGRA